VYSIGGVTLDEWEIETVDDVTQELVEQLWRPEGQCISPARSV
jgi:hypothetical protein